MRLRSSGRVRSFGQLLVTYSVSLVAIVLIVGALLFAVIFGQLSQVQQQMSRYATVMGLATHLSEQHDALDRLLFSATNEEQKIWARSDMSAAETRARTMLKRLETAHEVNPQQYFLLRGISNGLDFISEQTDHILENLPLDVSGYTKYYMIDTTFNYLNEYVYARFLSSAVTQDAAAVERMQETTARIRLFALLIVLLFAVIYTLAIVFVVRSLAHPIRSMANTAKEISSGNLETPDLPAVGPSEIRFLEQSLNSMKASLKERIETLDQNALLEKRLHQQELKQVKTKRELDRARLLTLQAQINPHFLFNAMNTISRTALFENAEKTGELVNDLAGIFRYMLDQRTTVPLREELDFITKYLKIQKIRFGERLDYAIECPQELHDILIPPLIIQPFVENAIIHGLEPLEEGGTVQVAIASQRRKLSIVVSDTGVGIESDKRDTVLDAQGLTDHGHIGMTNVLERIKLYYGTTSEMHIEDGEPRGTVIRLHLPIRKQDRMGMA